MPPPAAELRPHLAAFGFAFAKSAPVDDALVEALGRAFGTFLRRRGERSARLVVGRARDEEILCALQGALTRGLVQCGHALVDVGAGDSGSFSASVEALGAAGGAEVGPADEEAWALRLALGGAPLLPADLEEIAAIARAGDFAAGEGSVERKGRAEVLSGEREG